MSIQKISKTMLCVVIATLSSGIGQADSLARCEDARLGADALCGSIAVPENRKPGQDRIIELNLIVLPATGETTKEPLFLLAGGPGQGATDLVGLGLGPFAPVRETRDMVFVDQRGTGASNRIDCPIDADEQPQDAFGRLFDPARLRPCLGSIEEHADPTRYTTDIVVDDLEAVRQALGYDRVLLWGGSGGTRTGLVWMRKYPKSVAGALLDGVTPTDFRAPSSMARGCQETLDHILADCRAQADCNAAFPGLDADFAKVLKMFDAGPVATHIVDPEGTEIPVEMYRGDFVYAVRGLLYSSRTLPTLPAWLHKAAATGDLHPFAQAYWQRQVGLRPVVAMGVHLGVYCSEDLPFIAVEDVPGFTDGTFVGRYLYDQYRGACDVWEASPVDPSFLGPVVSDVPVLIFSGYYDPSTPPRLGDEIAAHLPNSRHVIVRNESHGAEFGCGLQAAVAFMNQGSLDGLGSICEDQGPIQYEVDP